MAQLLLVDDQEVVRKTVRSLLVDAGIDVCGEAGTGKQAINEAKRLRPDVIVLDHSLPDLTGLQAAYEIRQFLPNVKIVYFTVHDEAVISSAARVTGADAFVSKTSFGELVVAVRRLIENSGPLGHWASSIGPTQSRAAED